MECAKRVDILYDSVRSDKIQADTSAFRAICVKSVGGLLRERKSSQVPDKDDFGAPNSSEVDQCSVPRLSAHFPVIPQCLNSIPCE